MESKVILLVVIGTVAVMLMAFTVVFFVLLYKRRVLENELQIKALETKHQQEMLNATLRSQEAERNRLGSELHDSVGATLSSIKMNIQISIDKETTKHLNPMLDFLNDAIIQVRDISHQMMPIVLKKYGVKKAIEDLFEKTSNEKLRARIKEWDELVLSEENEIMLYRIVQELITNSLKHSNASLISVQGVRKNGHYTFSYSDDGIGYPESVIKKSEGMGMYNILNRAQVLEASVDFSNGAEGGAVTKLVFKQAND